MKSPRAAPIEAKCGARSRRVASAPSSPRRRAALPTRGEQFLAEVRSWIGTPFHPQAAAKGQGCDCKGLIWGPAREIGFAEAATPYARFIAYDLARANGVPSALLKQGMAALFDRTEEMLPGDILLLNSGGRPAHLAVYAGDGKAIHAQIKSKPWVKETSLRALLQVCPLDSVWRWRDG